MTRTLLLTAGLIVLMTMLFFTDNLTMAYEPEKTPIDWSGDEINADANPLANGDN